MTHTYTTRKRMSVGYVTASVIALFVFIVSVISQEAVVELLRWVILLFVTGLACSVIYLAYWLTFVRPRRNHDEPPRKIMLDEVGKDLEWAAEHFVDYESLKRIRRAHRLQHKAWEHVYDIFNGTDEDAVKFAVEQQRRKRQRNHDK